MTKFIEIPEVPTVYLKKLEDLKSDDLIWLKFFIKEEWAWYRVVRLGDKFGPNGGKYEKRIVYFHENRPYAEHGNIWQIFRPCDDYMTVLKV